MINLMPTEDKRQIHAARTNVVLLRYIIIVVLTFLFMLAALGFSYSILTGVKSAAQRVSQNNVSEVSANTQANIQVKQLQSSLSSAKTVLSNDIDYPKVLTRIGAATPPGVILSTLTLNSTTFGAPTTVQFLVKTNSAGTALQSKLQASPYFAGVTLQSLQSNSGNPAYPFTASFTLTINRSILQ